MKIYQSMVPPGLVMRVGDIDGDLKFDVEVRETMGLYIWHFPSLYEMEEREMFCSFIKPGCTVLDVGANIGLYSLLAAKRGAQVFSIEADPLNATMLRHHIEINGFKDRVTVFEMAATEREQPVTLYRHPINGGQSNIMNEGQMSGTVQGKTLDSLSLPPVDICKMDIEGAELMALQGFTRTLSRSPHMKLLIEYARERGAGPGLINHLRANFGSVKTLEAVQKDTDEIPPFCNLLCTN